MTISFVAATSAAANSITLPTHAAGDLILCAALREAQNPVGQITMPSGWAFVRVGGSASAHMIGARIAASSAETSGTWTNATHMVSAVYRASGNRIVIPAQGSNTANTSTTLGFLVYGSGVNSPIADRWVIGFASTGTSGVGVGTAPASLTNRVTLISTDDFALHDSAGNIDWAGTSAANRNTTLTGTSVWASTAIEIVEMAFAASTAGMLVHPGMSGGMRG